MIGDFSTLVYSGVSYHLLRRFETTCHIHVIDLALVHMQIVYGFKAVTDRAFEYDAQLAHNANGWGLQPVSVSLSNEILIIEGRVVQAIAVDGRPCMNITQDGLVQFLERPNFQTSWNVIGFDRIIAKDGVYNTRISDNNSDPRTIYGVDASGCLIVLVCEGRRGDERGLTFAEVWSIMQEFNVTSCGNADGGYSSCFYDHQLGGLMNPTYEAELRHTVCQVLFFANELGEVPEGDVTMSDKAIVRVSARFRSKPTLTTSDTGASSEVGFEFVPAARQQDINNLSVLMVQVPATVLHVGAGKWLPVQIENKLYTELVEVVVPPIEPVTSHQIVIDFVGEVVTVATVTVDGVVYHP